MPESAAQSTSSAQSPRRPEGFDLQGHRGARGLLPENTIPAFRRALEIGVTTLEMDVVIAGDGTVVVSHEPWMAREKCQTPNGDRIPREDERSHNIYRMGYEEIRAYDCGRLTLSDFPEQEALSAPKPRLVDVIRMAESYVKSRDRRPVFYNIETKSRREWEDTYHPDPETFVERVLAVIRREGVGRRTTIQSFDFRTVREAARASLPVRTAVLVGLPERADLEDTLSRLSFEPDVYSPDLRLVDGELIEAAHDQGLVLIPWTVNDPAKMRRLIRLGVDGLITDYPDRGRSVLQEMDVSF